MFRLIISCKIVNVLVDVVDVELHKLAEGKRIYLSRINDIVKQIINIKLILRFSGSIVSCSLFLKKNLHLILRGLYRYT